VNGCPRLSIALKRLRPGDKECALQETGLKEIILKQESTKAEQRGGEIRQKKEQVGKWKRRKVTLKILNASFVKQELNLRNSLLWEVCEPKVGWNDLSLQV